ncbi:MAG TPA: hypothetical protein ENF38_00645 [Candidatus Aenigmarchaeota archaeon]|nr:hypothetical protein [Candidatus Aenigmarchaeota archaeon]
MVNEKVRMETLEKLKEEVVGKPSEKIKAKKKELELKEKFGVMEKIPERPVEEEEEIEEELPEEKKEEISLPELLLRIEKIDGKLEVIEGFRKGVDERIQQLSEEIGELRSMILEKERAMSEMETNIEKFMEQFSTIDIEKIRKMMEKRDAELMEIRANIEKLESSLNSLRSDVKKIEFLIDRIKNFENLVKLSKRMSDKLARMEDAHSYVSKLVGKVETIFMELSEKLSDVEAQKERIKKLDELATDIVRTLDETSAKFVNLVKKKELEARLKEFEKKIREVEAKISKIKAVKITSKEKGKIKTEIVGLEEVKNLVGILEKLILKLEEIDRAIKEVKSEY